MNSDLAICFVDEESLPKTKLAVACEHVKLVVSPPSVQFLLNLISRHTVALEAATSVEPSNKEVQDAPRTDISQFLASEVASTAQLMSALDTCVDEAAQNFSQAAVNAVFVV